MDKSRNDHPEGDAPIRLLSRQLSHIDLSRVDLEQIKAVLAATQPCHTRITLKSVVHQHRQVIQGLRRRGLTLAEIAAVYQAQGIPLLEATLRKYLHLQAQQKTAKAQRAKHPTVPEQANFSAATPPHSGDVTAPDTHCPPSMPARTLRRRALIQHDAPATSGEHHD